MIFAHHDADARVRPYVRAHLDALREVAARRVFVTTAPLEGPQPDVDRVIVRQNVGFDFGSWREALRREVLDDVDELVLVNSSVFGPMPGGLRVAFRRMREVPADFWGMTDSHQFDWHLQSYFLVFRRPLLQSEAFAEFWERMLLHATKAQTIRSYELGLTQWLRQAGFRGVPLIGTARFTPEWRKRLWPRAWKMNPTARYAPELLDAGMPYVKVELLRDNPYDVPLGPVRARMKAAGYDLDLVAFDRAIPPRPGSAAWFARFTERV